MPTGPDRRQALAIAGGAAVLFAGLTFVVARSNSPGVIDAAVAGWFQSHRSGVGDAIFIPLALIGSPAAIGLLGVGVGLVLLWHRRWQWTAVWVRALVGCGLVNLAVKALLRRQRPPHDPDLLFRASWSYPSGHVMGSVVGFGMLAWLLIHTNRGRERRGPIIDATAAVIFLVGLSRLYLGVHYLSDVLGAISAGVAWLALMIAVAERHADVRGAAATAAHI
jgi:undecaprenyl-diphosphatase